MVCLRNVSVDTLHKGDTDEEDDDDNDDNDNDDNDNNNKNNTVTILWNQQVQTTEPFPTTNQTLYQVVGISSV
jgi:hypothetical protein